MMLAHRGEVGDIPRLQEAGYLFDLKIDGVRCLAEVNRGKAVLSSRTGQDITSCFPDVAELLVEAYPSGRVVLDGEIVVLGDDGFPSWPRTHKRAMQVSKVAYWAKRLPAHFYAFDILNIHNTDLRDEPYATRRQILEREVKGWPDRLQSTAVTADGDALWALVQEHRLEGMLAKRPASTYRPGRSRNWVKIKRTSSVSCLVGGFDPGEGSRANTFGCLHLYLIDDGTLVPVGKVGSGFSDKEAKQVMQRLHHPPLIVEVEYLDRSPDGQLRQPVFQRIREDLDVTDCTLDQLT